MGTLAPSFVQQFEDTNGLPIVGAKLYSWLAGTTTPTPLFQDANLTAAHPWPAIADGAGRLTYFLAPTSYKLELRDANDAVVIPAVDLIESVPSGNVNVDITGVAGENLAERQVVYLSAGTGGETVGRWYLTDADVPHKSSAATLVGVVVSPVISTGQPGQIRLEGTRDGYAGLSPGVTYYASATPGGIVNVAPTNAKVIGIAQSATVLLLTPSSSSSGALGVFTQLQVTSTGVDAIVLSGGLQTAAGARQLVAADGRIPAIDSTRFASLSGANLTSLNASNVASGTLADARLSANVGLKNANELVTGAWGFQTTVVGLLRYGFRNLSNNPVSATVIDIGNDAAGTAGELVVTSSTFPSSGWNLTDSLAVMGARPGGLSLAAVDPAGAVRIYTGGNGTPRVAVDAAGVLTGTNRVNSFTAQPGFLAYNSANDIGLGSGPFTVEFDTEVYDDGGNFAGNTFTAPVTGRYRLEATVMVAGGNAGANPIVTIVTSNRSYRIGNTTINTDSNVFTGSVTADMDVGDTATVTVLFSFSNSGNSIFGAILPVLNTYFSGRLIP